MLRLICVLLLAFPCLVNAQSLRPEHRIQGLGTSMRGTFDPDLHSPKSAAFSQDGRMLFVNALESGKTLVYGVPSFKRLAVIDHTFGAHNQGLFQGQSSVFDYAFPPEVPPSRPNHFMGKPVEMAQSHQGRYLWVPYYRRSTDPRAAGPSAVGIIDTRTLSLVRVMPSGPLPKFVAISPDSQVAVIVHWGDNSLIKLDIASENPAEWSVSQHWSVGPRLDVRNVRGDRDKVCGFCLRGAVFTKDSQTLLVARMGGGGIAGFDVPTGTYLGTISNIPATPRHLVMSKRGDTLWVSSNVSGNLSRFQVAPLITALRSANGKTVAGPRPEVLQVGSGARTVEVSPDERYAFIATNTSRAIAVVDLARWQKVETAPASPFPVGLAVSPDGCRVVSTSQGRAGQGGGNAVDIWNRCPANP